MTGNRWYHLVFGDGTEAVLGRGDFGGWNRAVSTTEIQLAPLSAVVCEEGSRDWAVVQKMRGLRVANCHSPSSEYDTVHSIVNSLWLSGFLTLTDSPKPEAPKVEPIGGVVCPTPNAYDDAGNPISLGFSGGEARAPKAESDHVDRDAAAQVAYERAQQRLDVKLAMEWAGHTGQYDRAHGSRIRTLMDEVKRLRAVVVDEPTLFGMQARTSGGIPPTEIRLLRDGVEVARLVSVSKSPPADLLTKEEREAVEWLRRGCNTWIGDDKVRAKVIVPALDRLAPAPAWKPKGGDRVRWWADDDYGTGTYEYLTTQNGNHPHNVRCGLGAGRVWAKRVEPLEAEVRDIRPAKEESRG